MALNIGAEDKFLGIKKVYWASGLGLVMLILLTRFLWQTFGPSPEPAAPVAPVVATAPQSTNAPATPGRAATKVGGLAALDPTLHPELMKQAESLTYTGNGRNIFSMFSAPAVIPKPVASVRQEQAQVGPPPPPPPPPINLGFYGYATEKSGGKQVFLLHGDDIFIASEGDVVDRRYRVVKIGAFSVQVEDIPYHNTQSLPLRQ
jgi:hypothetical protein